MFRATAGTAVLLALAVALDAQSVAASETSFVPASGVPASGGQSASIFGNTVEFTLGQPLVGQVAASPNFIVQGSVAWTPPAFSTLEPVVAGVRHVVGAKDGGDAVSVFGYGFQSPGGGTLDVRFAGALGLGTAVIGNTEATTTTPAGTDVFTNPLADVDVLVTNALGAHTANGAFTYGPALIEDLHTTVGGHMRARFQTLPGDFLFFAIGKSVGIGVPIPGFAGQAQLLLNVELLLNFVPVPSGSFLIEIPVPSDPALAGAQAEFQAVALHDPIFFSATFSNLFAVTILP